MKKSTFDIDTQRALHRTQSIERFSPYLSSPIDNYPKLSKSQTSIKTILKGILNSLSPSPSKDLVAIGGRDTLKIYSTGRNVQEVYNLRGVSSKSNLNFSSNDIKWGNTSLIASASPSGAILVFDLGKASNDKLGI